MTYYVGIDVSAESLAVMVNRAGKMGKLKHYPNTATGIQQLIRYLNPKKRDVKVALEATGNYHLDLAVALSRTPSVEVMVINPQASYHFAKARMQHDKTDASDAEMLTAYVMSLPMVPWQAPSEEVLTLRSYARCLHDLTESRVRLKNQRHAWESAKVNSQEVIQVVERQLAFLEQEREALESRAIAHIEAHPSLAEHFQHFLTVKGIGHSSAIALLAEVLMLPETLTHRQWVSHAGLSPRQRSSGTSVRHATRIGKSGNRYLRKALYMPALSAVRFIPEVKAYYTHLVEENGLKKLQAIVAVMRKLLHALHGMIQKRAPFDQTRFFKPILPKKA